MHASSLSLPTGARARWLSESPVGLKLDICSLRASRAAPDIVILSFVRWKMALATAPRCNYKRDSRELFERLSRRPVNEQTMYFLAIGDGLIDNSARIINKWWIHEMCPCFSKRLTYRVSFCVKSFSIFRKYLYDCTNRSQAFARNYFRALRSG